MPASIEDFLYDGGYELVLTRTIAGDESIEGELYPNKTALNNLLKEAGFYCSRILVINAKDDNLDKYEVKVYAKN